ncbi:MULTISPECIES: DUF6599 family protein [unclassified Saccharicrinis]|uniref:DUF6599 family protein n=1 Tax=unclassified Saccharicrinis TaxID=2646859 RepID=UPI003D356E39
MNYRKLFLLLILSIQYSAFSQSYPTKFANINAWDIEGEKQYFSPDNLYDYINGASDFYLGYDFKDLWVVDYKNSSGQMLTLELYRHGNPMLAFGIYSEERPQTASINNIGAQGFIDGGAVFLLAGDYYVKIYNGQPEVNETELLTFARRVAASICKDCSLPMQFNWFPNENKIDYSERYMAENFIGLTGFDGVCTVEYNNAGEKIRLFAYKGNDEKCKTLLEKYFDRVKYKKKLKPKQYVFADPYIGKVVLVYDRGMICGLLDSKEPEKHQQLLNDLLTNAK